MSGFVMIGVAVLLAGGVAMFARKSRDQRGDCPGFG